MRNRKGLCLAVAITLAAPTFAPSIVHAQSKEDLDKAKALFNAGAQAYSLGQYLPSIQAFEEAYKIAPKPAILFSLAQAQRKQWVIDKDPTRLEAAVKQFRQYLAEVASGGRRADAVQALSELEPALEAMKAKGMPAPTAAPPVKQAARLMVTSPTTGAQVSLDGASTSEAPFIGEVKPGKHTVIVSAKGHDDEKREIQVLDGGLVAVDLTLKEKPALLDIKAPSGAEITIDGRVVGVAPLAAPLSASHGRHFVAVMKNGALAWTKEVDLVRGENQKLEPQLTTSGQRTASYFVLGFAGAAVLTGGVFTVLALGKQKDAQSILDEKAIGNISPSRLGDYDDARSARDRWKLGALIGYGAGAALATAGFLLFAFDRPKTPSVEMEPQKPGGPSKEPPKPSMDAKLIPIVAPTYVGASFGFAF